jgi:hypothetical protein
MARRRLTNLVNNWPNNWLDELISQASKPAMPAELTNKNNGPSSIAYFLPPGSASFIRAVCANSLSKTMNALPRLVDILERNQS